MHMQQVKTYTSGMFKREARYQFLRDLKKMAKRGWHLHTITDEGVGRGLRVAGVLYCMSDLQEQLSELRRRMLLRGLIQSDRPNTSLRRDPSRALWASSASDRIDQKENSSCSDVQA